METSGGRARRSCSLPGFHIVRDRADRGPLMPRARLVRRVGIPLHSPFDRPTFRFQERQSVAVLGADHFVADDEPLHDQRLRHVLGSGGGGDGQKAGGSGLSSHGKLRFGGERHPSDTGRTIRCDSGEKKKPPQWCDGFSWASIRLFLAKIDCLKCCHSLRACEIIEDGEIGADFTSQSSVQPGL